MTWVVLLLLGVLALALAINGDRAQRRAEFWERMYLESKTDLDRMLEATEAYLDAEDAAESAVLRVWASQN